MINGSTKIYGIMGNPVKHSLSPVMHNRAFRELGENAVYLPFCVEDVPSAIKGMKAMGIHGISVTIPHKESVFKELDEVDPVALKIGAVNTLHFVKTDGVKKVHGSNTDWLGANRALQEKIDLAGKKAVIFGAGGSARAIGFGLQEAGCEISLCSRTEAKGRELADKLGCQWNSLSEANSLTGDVLINATSVGMTPLREVCLISQEGLRNFGVVMDIVYAPLKTKLLKDADAVGCQVINGLEMLLYQGVAQFELWTGKVAPVEVMRQELMKATGN